MAEFIASVTQELEDLQRNLFSQHARIVDRLRARHQQLIAQDPGVLGSTLPVLRPPLKQEKQASHLAEAASTSVDTALQCHTLQQSIVGSLDLPPQEDTEEEVAPPRTPKLPSLAVGRPWEDEAGAQECEVTAQQRPSVVSEEPGFRLSGRSQSGDFEEPSAILDAPAISEGLAPGGAGSRSRSNVLPAGVEEHLQKARRAMRSVPSKLPPRQEWQLCRELVVQKVARHDEEEQEEEQSPDTVRRKCLETVHLVRNAVDGRRMSGSSAGNHQQLGFLGIGESNEELVVGSCWQSCWPQPPFNPHSMWRLRWDMLGITLVMYEMLTIPVLLLILPSFESFSHLMDLCCNVYWSTDIVLVFLTCIEVEGELMRNFRWIACHYARTWLAMDLLMVCPEWILFYVRSRNRAGLSVLRTLKISRLLRLLRVLKMENIVRKQLSRFNSLRVLNLLKLCQMLIGFLVLNHFIACIWYFIGVSTRGGWVPKYLGVHDAGYGYAMSLHWAISEFHGNADVTPGNIPECIFAVAMQVVGMLVLSIFISTTTNIILAERKSRAKLNQQMESLNMYFLHHKVSARLMLDVKTHLKAANDQREWMDDLEVLKALPDTLWKCVLYEVRMPTLERHWLFQWLKEQHGGAARTICHNALTPLRQVAGTLLFEVGDAWEKLIFVEEGHLRYIAHKAKEPQSTRRRSFVLRQTSQKEIGINITKKTWLCELALWVQGWHSRGDFVSVSNSFTLCLDSASFAQDLKNFPDAHLDVVMYVHGILQEIPASDYCKLDDLWRPP